MPRQDNQDGRTDVWQEYSDELAGGWKCISFEIFDNPGPDQKLLAKPHGDSPLARLYLSQNGWIAVHTADPKRSLQQLPSGKTWQMGDDAEVAYVAKGLTMWCGYLHLFQYRDDDIRWEALVEVSCDPGRIGKYETRRLRLFTEGDKQLMALSTINPLNVNGQNGYATLTWEKFE